MSGYFASFPRINYFGVLCVNITLRAAFLRKLKQNAQLFYPYVVRDGETPDAIAFDYYGSPDYDWLVFLSNDIIDPYTQWVKPQQQFDEYIIKVYGSIEQAQSQIMFYRRIPDVSYISYDGVSFGNAAIPSSFISLSNTDIRITPDSYALVDDPLNWNPVYAYDDESQQNEDKRNILLIDRTMANSVKNELVSLLNG